MSYDSKNDINPKHPPKVAKTPQKAFLLIYTYPPKNHQIPLKNHFWDPLVQNRKTVHFQLKPTFFSWNQSISAEKQCVLAKKLLFSAESRFSATRNQLGQRCFFIDFEVGPRGPFGEGRLGVSPRFGAFLLFSKSSQTWPPRFGGFGEVWGLPPQTSQNPPKRGLRPPKARGLGGS